MRSQTKDLISDEAGTVALEYGLIASLFAIALITGLSSPGNKLSTSFWAVADAIVSNEDPEPPQPAAR
ncbi:Flp family type IVb pilin [Aquidulcibacter sp.]|uniref:Flp family type IVb pilin n=1 Tax=Aquidulcibacter sp. TaxID=2052990 RepID=UPI0028AE2BCA|nr:Flp family type IVb pilin [Aquidulcibacter sp.]